MGTKTHQKQVSTAFSVTRDLEAIEHDVVLNSLHPDHVPAATLKPVEASIVHKIPKSLAGKNQQIYNLYSAKSRLDTKELEYWNERTKQQQEKGAGTLRRIGLTVLCRL